MSLAPIPLTEFEEILNDHKINFTEAARLTKNFERLGATEQHALVAYIRQATPEGLADFLIMLERKENMHAQQNAPDWEGSKTGE